MLSTFSILLKHLSNCLWISLCSWEGKQASCFLGPGMLCHEHSVRDGHAGRQLSNLRQQPRRAVMQSCREGALPAQSPCVPSSEDAAHPLFASLWSSWRNHDLTRLSFPGEMHFKHQVGSCMLPMASWKENHYLMQTHNHIKKKDFTWPGIDLEMSFDIRSWGHSKKNFTSSIFEPSSWVGADSIVFINEPVLWTVVPNGFVKQLSLSVVELLAISRLSKALFCTCVNLWTQGNTSEWRMRFLKEQNFLPPELKIVLVGFPDYPQFSGLRLNDFAVT